jgi:hypothetical protein
MRTILAAVLSVVVILGLAASPAFAQPPAPKVTINGLVDFATSYYRNVRDNNITNTQDEGWYSRERGVFTFTGEIGKAKGVIAFEFDFTNGAGPASSGTTTNFDLDTDVAGTTEVKWLYVEAPLTGPGSLLPFLPMESLIRAGAQPATGHAYKPGILWSGDFPGVNITTTWAPNMRSTLTFAQIGEQLDSLAGGNEDIAALVSFEFDLFKGLTIKPTYTYANYDAFNTGTANLGTEPKGGFDANILGAHLTRHTIGVDVRWRSGPFSLEPTFIYQIGTQECTIASCGHTNDVDINSWIFDMTGGFRTGPLTIEGRFAYTPGMKAEDCVQAAGTATGGGVVTGAVCGAGGKDIKYYQAINPGFVYQAGWAEIQASGVDYNLVHFGQGNTAGTRLGQSPSYDKYGRITLAAAVDYAVTPAFILHAVGNAQWTAEKVDTDGTYLANVANPNGITPQNGGNDNYLGTEIDVGFTYRFAPNVAFDLLGGYLIAGDARGVNGQEPEDITKVTARLRVTW